MKIAFWSCSKGRSGVTSNLACISVLSNLFRPHRTILFENHQSLNNLGNALICPNPNNYLREDSPYFIASGLERVLKEMDKNQWINEESIVHSSHSFLEENLFYIPRSPYVNQEFMEFELNQYIYPLLNMLENFCETVYIDTASSHYKSTQNILHQADMVVVNLTQNPYVLSHFFQNFSSIREKAFYLIGQYDHSSIFHKQDIMTRYGIKANQIGTIPYNISFSDAVLAGKVIPFLQESNFCSKKEKIYDFMETVKESTLLIEARMMMLRGEGRER